MRNMFPHTITLYTLDSSGESYTKEIVKGVYWYGSHGLSTSGKGQEKNNSITIVIPSSKRPEALKKGAIVVKGSGDDILSIKDLDGVESVKISSYADYDAGSGIDNIVVTCV